MLQAAERQPQPATLSTPGLLQPLPHPVSSRRIAGVGTLPQDLQARARAPSTRSSWVMQISSVPEVSSTAQAARPAWNEAALSSAAQTWATHGTATLKIHVIPVAAHSYFSIDRVRGRYFIATPTQSPSIS